MPNSKKHAPALPPLSAVEGETYTVTPLHDEQGKFVDIQVNLPGSASLPSKQARMLGPAGAERETALAHGYLNTLPPDALPVLLGSGLGHALNYLLENRDGPVAVVDREAAILAHTGLGPQFDERIRFISEPDPEAALIELTEWQQANGNLPLSPLLHPFYLRLGEQNRAYYTRISETLKASRDFNFWEKVDYPRFSGSLPRILLITRQYFLMGEIIEACEDLNIPHRMLQVSNDDMVQEEFVQDLLRAVLEFKPDFLLTINHLGVDREGFLVDLLERLNLPLASWFVDNPHLIIYQYQGLASPWTSIFTWDADNLASLKADGFQHVHYLPLATTPGRFRRKPQFSIPAEWQSGVSFVGNSMEYKVKARMKAADPGPELRAAYREIATGFANHESRSVLAYLELEHAELLPAYDRLDSIERRLAFETMITWEATRQYRKSCIEQLLAFNPLILGDEGWEETFKHCGQAWRWHSEINYYEELPFFYPQSQINFNCTSKQMKGAVNQRVFDVPAAGAFVLTDWRAQMDQLFEPEREVIFYREPDEVPELVRFYLNRDSARQKVMDAARARILKDHTYTLRLQEIIRVMQGIYG